jgi:hypothetical protein
VVNPKEPFREEAERRGWPVVRWADRRLFGLPPLEG